MVVTRGSAFRPGRTPKYGAKVEGSAPDPESPIARARKAAERAKDEGNLSQAEKFEKAAAALGCDFDDETFMGVLRNLAKQKAS